MTPAPTVSPVAERAHASLGHLSPGDELRGYPFAHFLEGLGRILQQFDDLVREQADGVDGLAAALDPDRAPSYALGFIATLAGARPPKDLPVSAQREAIKQTPAQDRGQEVAIKATARQHLTDPVNGAVTLYGFVGGDPYEALLVTYEAQTAPAATVGLLESRYATVADVEADWASIGALEQGLSPDAEAITRALPAVKPLGLRLVHRIDAGWSVGQLEAAYAGQTIADVEGDYTDIEELETVIPNG